MGIPHDGWVPKGHKTEVGPLPGKYNLKELGTTSYPKRTERNILDSHGTVIFTYGKLTGGSALTRKLANAHGFPCLHIDLNKIGDDQAANQIKDWLQKNKIRTLNIAGSRAIKHPEIYQATRAILAAALAK